MSSIIALSITQSEHIALMCAAVPRNTARRFKNRAGPLQYGPRPVILRAGSKTALDPFKIGPIRPKEKGALAAVTALPFEQSLLKRKLKIPPANALVIASLPAPPLFLDAAGKERHCEQV